MIQPLQTQPSRWVNFVKSELYFLSDFYKKPPSAVGRNFFDVITLILEAWHGIKDEKNPGLARSDFLEIASLVDAIETFLDSDHFPETSQDYGILPANKDWDAIVGKGRALYSHLQNRYSIH